jgi:hypothetical protein
MANLYASLTELKAALGIGPTDTADDTLLTVNLEAASREIDAYCARHFYQDTGTRYFTAEHASTCFVDDLVSVTTLSTDDTSARSYGTTWATTDYDLCPVNAASRGEPFTWLELTPNTTKAFPTAARAIKIIGVFGYPVLPWRVKQACLIQAARYHMRPHAPFGVVGNADMGQMQVVPKLDPDVALLLSGLRRPGADAI